MVFENRTIMKADDLTVNRFGRIVSKRKQAQMLKRYKIFFKMEIQLSMQQNSTK